MTRFVRGFGSPDQGAMPRMIPVCCGPSRPAAIASTQRAPNTSPSSSEFEASRLAPWTPESAHSPHAQSPGRVVAERVTVVREDVVRWLGERERAEEPPWNVVLLDPPYEDTTAMRTSLERLGTLVAPEARVVAKHFWRDAPPERAGLLASDRVRRFGETALTFYRREEDA